MITGSSGYIGSHVTLQFLQDGTYRVRGTVRDLENQAKIDPIRQAFGEELFGQLELVQADLNDEDSMTRAIEGATYVVHIASPLQVYQTEEEFVRPAVNGTLAILRACKANGVRRFVMTSSIASCMYPSESDRPESGIIDASIWSEVKSNPQGFYQFYQNSKILAEKAAWDYQQSLPESERFEITTILPSFIMGPNLRAEWFASCDWLIRLMTGKLVQISAQAMGVADVREVAYAHLQAIIGV